MSEDEKRLLASMQMRLQMRESSTMDACADASMISMAIATYYRGLTAQGIPSNCALTLTLQYQAIALYGDNAQKMLREMSGYVDSDEDKED